MQRNRHCFGTAVVSESASTKLCCIGVENFVPLATIRHADTVIWTRYRTEIAEHQQGSLRRFLFTQEAQHVVVGVLAIDPFEAVGRMLTSVQRAFRAIQVVEFADQKAQL